MKILVFGRTGQVARALLAPAPGADEVVALGREQADLSDPAACAAAIEAHAPDAVINAAAYTAVDRAEREEALATVINGAAPGAMARACAGRGIVLVHLSTDYVFGGGGGRPWRPQDAPDPQNAYGRSKLAGEQAVQAAGGTYAILRTSWVFSAHGQNFLRTMMRLGGERAALDVVADQVGGPTPADAIAGACLSVARQLSRAPDKRGIYHFSGAPDVSWADFAREIMAGAGLDCEIRDIASSAWPTLAPRPLNSRLDCSSMAAAFAIPRPDWKAAARRMIGELAADL